MNRLLPIALTVTLVTSLGVASLTTTSEPNVVRLRAETDDPPGIYGADAATTARIQQAMRRFAEEGLDLPELRIYVHATTAGCDGALGRFNLDGTGRRIDLCDPDAAFHELAHAWEHHRASDATRQAFLDHTGLATWNSANVGWEERGIERAATAVAWGLQGPLLASIQPLHCPRHCREMLARYHLLTGRCSPRYPDGVPHTEPAAAAVSASASPPSTSTSSDSGW